MSDRDEALRRAQQAMRRLQHEVRTPIGQIIGYAELLGEELEERGAEDLAPDLEKIRTAAQRLLDLADGKLREEHDPGAPVLPEATEEEATAIKSPDIGLLYVLGVNGQLLMHYAALKGYAWNEYLDAMRDGVKRHGPVREGLYAMTTEGGS